MPQCITSSSPPPAVGQRREVKASIAAHPPFKVTKMIFSERAIEVLKETSVGEPIAVTGEITAEIYAPAGSESRINWRITVDGILSARKVKPEGATRKPQAAKGRRDRAEASNTGGRALAAASWASPSPDADCYGKVPEWR
jgi:hypothetical protein